MEVPHIFIVFYCVENYPGISGIEFLSIVAQIGHTKQKSKSVRDLKIQLCGEGEICVVWPHPNLSDCNAAYHHGELEVVRKGSSIPRLPRGSRTDNYIIRWWSSKSTFVMT